MNYDDLRNRFIFHPATEKTGPQHERVRAECLRLARLFNEMLPDGREKSTAMTKLEEVMMWSNAAIARNSDI
jgi:hypothetical protein